MSDMTLTKILHSVGVADRATVHGFRSSFKNWTLEQTDTSWVVSEAALAHSLGNSTEQAYARSDLFERRRELMQMWADYVLDDSRDEENHLQVYRPNWANQVTTSSRVFTPTGP